MFLVHGPITLLNAVTTTGASESLYDDLANFRMRDWTRDVLDIEVTGSGAGIVLQARQSMDGTTWWPLTPTAIGGGTVSTNTMTANGLYQVNPSLPYVDVNLSGLSSGAVTVRAL